MSNHWCVVPGCKSDSRKRERIDKYPWMKNVTFRPFPTKLKQPRLRSKWVQMIRRPIDYEPLPHHRVCSLHFTDDGNIPELFEWNNFKDQTTKRPAASIIKRERVADMNPTENVNQSMAEEASTDHVHPVCVPEMTGTVYPNDDDMDMECSSEIGLNSCAPIAVSYVEVETSFMDGSTAHIDDHSYYHSRKQFDTSLTCRDEGTQTDLSLLDLQDLKENLEKLTGKMADRNTLLRETFVAKVMESDQSISRYTGIPNQAIFDELSSITNEFEPNLKYWNGGESQENKKYQQSGKKPGPSRKLDRLHEFLITLLRLRLALPVNLLADLFGVSNARVSSIFTTWICYLNCIFKDMITWPSKELILKHMPRSFKKHFPRTRCIIDCSEIFIQRPRNPSLQCKTYSNYKSHNTYKFLVGITPTGAISFISDIWGGNTSDRYITMNSGFLDLLSAGDEIMADRGFTIRDLLTERHAYLNIPPFTRKCSWGKGKRLNASEIRKTRQIANHRIHVERAIQRLKTFKMLSNMLPWSVKSVVNPMIVVAAFLCNLMKPLVK